MGHDDIYDDFHHAGVKDREAKRRPGFTDGTREAAEAVAEMMRASSDEPRAEVRRSLTTGSQHASRKNDVSEAFIRGFIFGAVGIAAVWLVSSPRRENITQA